MSHLNAYDLRTLHITVMYTLYIHSKVSIFKFNIVFIISVWLNTDEHEIQCILCKLKTLNNECYLTKNISSSSLTINVKCEHFLFFSNFSITFSYGGTQSGNSQINIVNGNREKKV